MAKALPANTLDSELDYIALSTSMIACSGEPANYAAVAGLTLATVTVAPGDFTKAAGTGSGARKLTVAAKSGVSVTATGTANHVVFVRAADSTLRVVTTCTSQALTSGNTVNFPQVDLVNMTQPT